METVALQRGYRENKSTLYSIEWKQKRIQGQTKPWSSSRGKSSGVLLCARNILPLYAAAKSLSAVRQGKRGSDEERSRSVHLHYSHAAV
eukprot:652026-Amphidinium_carterae.1